MRWPISEGHRSLNTTLIYAKLDSKNLCGGRVTLAKVRSMKAILTTMQMHADNYLSERRRLGFSLRSTGYAVKSFARHIDDLGHQGPLTVEVMADWARRDKGNSNKPATWARRLAKIWPFLPNTSGSSSPTPRCRMTPPLANLANEWPPIFTATRRSSIYWPPRVVSVPRKACEERPTRPCSA